RLLQRAAERTLDHASELQGWAAALSSGSDEAPSSIAAAGPLRAGHPLLVDLVRDKEAHATERLFFVLELIYREDFEEIWRGLRSQNARRRASSRELIENICQPPLRPRVLALVGEAAPRRTNLEPAAYERALREILARGSSTMRILAEYRAIELGIHVGEPATARDSDRGALARTLGARLSERKAEPSTTRGATRAPA